MDIRRSDGFLRVVYPKKLRIKSIMLPDPPTPTTANWINPMMSGVSDVTRSSRKGTGFRSNDWPMMSLSRTRTSGSTAPFIVYWGWTGHVFKAIPVPDLTLPNPWLLTPWRSTGWNRRTLGMSRYNATTYKEGYDSNVLNFHTIIIKRSYRNGKLIVQGRRNLRSY